MVFVLGISGSPRIGGNTDMLLDRALEGARDADAQVEKIVLNKLKMVPCQECEETKDDGTCQVQDDFQALYGKIKKADAVILAAPIFFGSLSAQTKIMVDRYQCHWKYRYILKKAKGEKERPGIFISVEASTRNDFQDNAKSIVKNFFATVGLSYKEELMCQGVDEKGAVQGHPEYLDKAFALGKKLL
jgi:multimeric flavodoxin WrbA